jgi:hypothetical protein
MVTLFNCYTEDILKNSCCKDNDALTGDTILFLTISQELWSFKKLEHITKKARAGDALSFLLK